MFNLSLLVISNFENNKKYILPPKTLQSLTKIVPGTSGSIIVLLEWISVVKIQERSHLHLFVKNVLNHFPIQAVLINT